MRAPMTAPLALRFSAKMGRSGKTMPKPIKSMKTVKKMMVSDGFFIRLLGRERPARL